MNNRSVRRNARKSEASRATNKILTSILTATTNTSQYRPPRVPDVVPLQLKRHKVFTFRGTYDIGNISSGVTEVDGSIFFTLSNLANAGSFASLFDVYRIVQAQVHFMSVGSPPSASLISPPILTVIDYDDSSTVNSAAAVQYDSLQIVPSGQTFSRTVNPRCAVSIYNGVATTGYGMGSSNQWIDLTNPGAPYYGVKYVIEPSATANLSTWRCYVDMIVQCRYVR